MAKTAGALPTLHELVKSQGRTFAWLARETSYSENHVRRVARGEAPGSAAFHNAVQKALGAEYRNG